MRSHTGEKPYTCPNPWCTKAFTQLSNMKAHQKRCRGSQSTMSTLSSFSGNPFSQRVSYSDMSQTSHSHSKESTAPLWATNPVTVDPSLPPPSNQLPLFPPTYSVSTSGSHGSSSSSTQPAFPIAANDYHRLVIPS
eukprot:Rmarinus@m.7716